MNHEKKYSIETEDLALPEIHTEHHPEPEPDKREQEPISYEPLAVPEVHIKKIKKPKE